MGIGDQIERYRQRAKIVLAGRRLKGRGETPAPAPFVCGVTRSGTTLLRLMLDSHPELAIPGETHWVPKLIKAFERSAQTADDAADLVIGRVVGSERSKALISFGTQCVSVGIASSGCE